MSVRIRAWQGDAAPLLDLARSVGWAWSESRARRSERLRPARTWLAEDEDGLAVGTVSAIVYGDAGHGALAWLAGMVVRPSHQRRGVGAALLAEAMAFAREHGTARMGLDATPQGVAMYERHGFRPVAVDAWWSRDPSAPLAPPSAPQGDVAIYPISSCEVMELHAYDQARFGANRAQVLAEPMAERPHHCFVAFDRRSGKIVGHVLSQEKVLGPLVADTPHAADWLLYAASMAGAPPHVHLVGQNPQAEAVFARAGWKPSGASCVRMALGGALPGEAAFTFALASWGLG